MKETNMIIDELKNILAVIFEGEIDVSGITEETSLVNDLGMNSVGMLYTALALEEHYNIKFENSDFAKLKTVKDVINRLESKV